MDATHNFRGYNRPLPVMQLLNDDFSFGKSDTVTTYHAHHEYYILMFNVIHIIDYINCLMLTIVDPTAHFLFHLE